ncbi:MAG TPA: HNH endonuclease signature motif containing protein [Cytophagaceae bacterium]|jgi:hypothetical protein|nr:HNH endonuclease signature motif containing protein [Cytophagaceae bacterium]
MTKQDHVWILKSKGIESAFGGNEGYKDITGTNYIYDTTVKNYDRIAVGDIAVITNKKYIEGFALIEQIDQQNNVPKKRYRCPICNTQEHYERKNVHPRFKCRKKHEFDEPVLESIFVEQFTAYYKFVTAPSKTPVQILNNYYIRRNFYYSIQPATIDLFHNEFPSVLNELFNTKNYIIESGSHNGITYPIPEYIFSRSDDRKSKTKIVISREGQQQFREMLFKYHNIKCILTGCNIRQAIEASHINPYMGKKDNHPANGFLLRRDVHAIFDSNLLGIHPETMKVYIHPSLKDSEYSNFEDHQIDISSQRIKPCKEALEYRWQLFNKKLSEIKITN